MEINNVVGTPSCMAKMINLLAIVKGRHIGLARSSNIDVYILAYLNQLLHYRREEDMQEGGEEEEEDEEAGVVTRM